MVAVLGGERLGETVGFELFDVGGEGAVEDEVGYYLAKVGAAEDAGQGYGGVEAFPVGHFTEYCYAVGRVGSGAGEVLDELCVFNEGHHSGGALQDALTGLGGGDVVELVGFGGGTGVDKPVGTTVEVNGHLFAAGGLVAGNPVGPIALVILA